MLTGTIIVKDVLIQYMLRLIVLIICIRVVSFLTNFLTNFLFSEDITTDTTDEIETAMKKWKNYIEQTQSESSKKSEKESLPEINESTIKMTPTSKTIDEWGCPYCDGVNKKEFLSCVHCGAVRKL